MPKAKVYASREVEVMRISAKKWVSYYIITLAMVVGAIHYRSSHLGWRVETTVGLDYLAFAFWTIGFVVLFLRVENITNFRRR